MIGINNLFILLFFSLFLSNCVSGGNALNSNAVIGSWKLSSFKIKKNELAKDWRSKANGLLIYTKDGYMSVSINSEENDNWLDSILFYAGTYQVNDGKIEHFVLNASSKSRIGRNMVREATLNDKYLTLQAEGDFGEAILVWEKQKSSQ